MYEGPLEGLLSSGTDTGRMLEARTDFNPSPLQPSGWFRVENASLHNLKGITVDFPLGVLTVVAGVAGSGKSSMIQCFMDAYPEPGGHRIHQPEEHRGEPALDSGDIHGRS